MLAENKFSKYLLYAFGEILLVVIGILIALQIGDLNEQKKKDQQKKVQIQLLREDLKEDLETLEIDFRNTENQLNIQNSFRERLSNRNVNLDTLKKIVRYEFSMGFTSLKELNKTTFNSLESSGKMDLLGNNLSIKVQRYYTNRNSSINILGNNKQIYLDMIQPFMFKYPGTFNIQGPLSDLYWDSVDLTELYGPFNSVLGMKMLDLTVRKRIVQELIDVTKSLINDLDASIDG
jgi:hypothetical protein